MSSGLKTAIKETDFSQTFAMAMNVKDVARKEGSPLGPRGGFGGGFGAAAAEDLMKDAEGLAFSISVKSDISWKGSVIFKDSKTAADAKKLYDAQIVLVKKDKNIPSEIADVIEKIEYKQSGNRVESSGSMETSKLIKIIKAFNNNNNMHR